MTANRSWAATMRPYFSSTNVGKQAVESRKGRALKILYARFILLYCSLIYKNIFVVRSVDDYGKLSSRLTRQPTTFAGCTHLN